jgi:hypothetical protein
MDDERSHEDATPEPSSTEYARGWEDGHRAGFDEGVKVGRTEGMGFTAIPALVGVTRGASFAYERSWFHAYVAYERDLLDDLRRVQRERWILAGDGEAVHERLEEAQRVLKAVEARLATVSIVERWWLRRTQPSIDVWREALEARLEHDARDARLAQLQRRIEDELWPVREAVDEQRAEGHGRASIVAALRAVPSRPPHVREYPTRAAFAAEEPRRALDPRAADPELGGMTFGWDWRLENPLRRWDTTRWEVGWLSIGSEATWEIYAAERLPGEGDEGPRAGRVWLIGTLRRRDMVREVLEEYQRHAIRERNSLAALAEAVRYAQERERWMPDQPDEPW